MVKQSRPNLCRYVLELFVLSNIAFLALDVFMAHSINHFHHPSEWIPFYFSILASVALIFSAALGPDGVVRPYGKWAGYLVGWCAIVIGVAGLYYHLASQFFQVFSISSLVYTAPFIAPLAYAGLGFLLILNRMAPPEDLAWSQWVIFFSMGGFLGNFVLTLCDHAQNGFFHISEWLPVITSAFAVGFLAPCVFGRVKLPFLIVTGAVIFLQIGVGMLGFYFHAIADLYGYSDSLVKNFIYGAPVFAPMLFADLAVLSFIGFWNYLAQIDSP